MYWTPGQVSDTSFAHWKYTGWLKSKLPFTKGYNSESRHFWPHVGNAKMHLREGEGFIWKIVNKIFEN